MPCGNNWLSNNVLLMKSPVVRQVHCSRTVELRITIILKTNHSLCALCNCCVESDVLEKK